MNITIVIPNWNGKTLLEKNLQAVLTTVDSYKDGESEIIVVDDGSSDNSIDFIESNYPDIRILKKKKNTGFSDSCNLGVKESKGEIVILLNNDVLPQKDFLLPLINHFKDPKIFAVGCLEKSLVNGKEILSGRNKAWFEKGLVWHSKADNMTESITFWVSGGSGAFRKDIWEKLGGFDPLFNPFYWEDIDLSYRAKKAGYEVYFEPKSIVFHNHESTIGVNFSKDEINVISSKNQLLFFWKNITDNNFLIQHAFWLPIHMTRNLLDGNSVFMHGFLKALKQLPNVLKQRKASNLSCKKGDLDILFDTSRIPRSLDRG